jgi:hypothetical protein
MTISTVASVHGVDLQALQTLFYSLQLLTEFLSLLRTNRSPPLTT